MIKEGHNTTAILAGGDVYAFLHAYVQKLPGWLEDYAAVRTMDLLAWQDANEVRGPLLEIGVFCGRYLALLLRSALSHGDNVLAIDTFQYAALGQVKEGLAPLVDPESVDWWQATSVSCSPRALLTRLGGEPRFISIDGSHESEDVVWDLRMAEEILASQGIVAVDDFLNPVTLGVNEGVHRFFATMRNLAPFAYAANKLFLSRPHQATIYAQVFEEVVIADHIEPRSESFRERQTHGRHHVELKLWGKPLLVVP